MRWDQENTTASGNWENCVRSQGAYFGRDWSVIVLCTMSLVFVSSSINVCFSYYMATYLLDRPHVCGSIHCSGLCSWENLLWGAIVSWQPPASIHLEIYHRIHSKTILSPGLLPNNDWAQLGCRPRCFCPTWDSSNGQYLSGDSPSAWPDFCRTALQARFFLHDSFSHSPFTGVRFVLWSIGSTCLFLLPLPFMLHRCFSQCLAHPNLSCVCLSQFD